MKSLRAFVMIALLFMTACGTIARPEMSAQEVQDQPSGTAILEMLPPTEVAETEAVQPTPTEEAQPTESQVSATTEPTSVPAPSTVGDAANGEVLFNAVQSEVGFACNTCHRVDNDQRLVGPSLMNVSEHAQHHNTGQRVEEYLHTSIADPGAYVVEGFINGLMPRTYSQIFTEQEINDLVAYLMTL